jgi:phosphate acetyltransferase
VARTVYVMALEPGSGKSAVVLGLTEMLSRRAGRLAFFRPFVAAADPPDPDVELVRGRYRLAQSHRDSYALTADDLHDVTDRNRYESLLKRILAGYRAVAADADVVVVEGSDFTEASLAVEIDLNVDAATHLDCPVLLVVGGRGRTAEQILDGVRQDLTALADRGCTLLGVICNRVEEATAAAVRAGLPAASGGLPAFVLPEVAMLAAPTVAEVADALGAEYLHRQDGARGGGEPAGGGSAGGEPAGGEPAGGEPAGGEPADGEPATREVSRLIVGAMSLPHFLERIADGDLVITPGDRADIVAGSLAAHLSGTYPAVAGLLLTGGLVDDPVRRLVAGLGDAGVPVIGVDTDTYTTTAAVGAVRGAITPASERKIATALGLFEDNVDAAALEAGIRLTRPGRMTPLMFEHLLLERARADRRHIVLPEGEDDRILRAAEQLLHRGVVDLTVLGSERDVRARAGALGLDLAGLRITDPQTSPLRESFARTYHELRRHKGVGLPLATDLMADRSYFATMMVHRGLADGMVSGAAHTTAHTIRPAFEVIRTAPHTRIVSSAFLMCLADRVLVYADCAVVPNPDAAQLADIAISAAGTAEMFGIQPRVAMLSYSTGESGRGTDVDRVRAATAIARERRPDLAIEGPIQYDAAVDAGVARAKLPDSPVAGRATVFVFPDLNTGNNTYKAVQRSAGAIAIGPILQGLNQPVNDLSRGATVADIVNTVAITAIQAQAVGR